MRFIHFFKIKHVDLCGQEGFPPDCRSEREHWPPVPASSEARAVIAAGTPARHSVTLHDSPPAPQSQPACTASVTSADLPFSSASSRGLTQGSKPLAGSGISQACANTALRKAAHASMCIQKASAMMSIYILRFLPIVGSFYLRSCLSVTVVTRQVVFPNEFYVKHPFETHMDHATGNSIRRYFPRRSGHLCPSSVNARVHRGINHRSPDIGDNPNVHRQAHRGSPGGIARRQRA